jgi:predicted exporter
MLLALDIRLNLFHLISLLLVLGIGLNYALFFQRYPGSGAPHPQAGLAVGVCGTTSAVAFACLAVSSVPALHAIGATVLLGTLFSLLYAAAFRPLNSPQNPG